MDNTIELLETIGSDASLRYASSENLTQVLIDQQASEGLKQAVCSGDKNHIMRELGPRADPPKPQSQTVGGCRDDEDYDTDEDHPDRDDDEDYKQAQIKS